MVCRLAQCLWNACLNQAKSGTRSSGDKVLKEVTEVNRPLCSIRGRLGLERAGAEASLGEEDARAAS